MEKDTEQQEALETPDETLDLELEEAVAEPQEPSNDENLQEQYQKTVEKNKQLFNRAKQAESELKKLKQVKPVETHSRSTDEIGDVLSLQANGYSQAEILKLREYSRKMNIGLSEIANEPFIKAGIESERSKQKSAEATPPPSSRSITVKGKSWAQMSTEEQSANFTKVRDSLVRK